MTTVIRRAPLLLLTALISLTLYAVIALHAYHSTAPQGLFMVLVTATLFPVFIGALFLWKKAAYDESPTRIALKAILTEAQLGFDPSAPAEELALIAKIGGRITTQPIQTPNGFWDPSVDETIVGLYDLNGIYIGECGELELSSEKPLI